MSTDLRPMAGLQRFHRAKEERFTFRQAIQGTRETCFTVGSQCDTNYRVWSHQSGKAYLVDASQCDCPDFQYRQGPNGHVCKHILALREYLKGGEE